MSPSYRQAFWLIPAGSAFRTNSISQDVDLVTVRLNYRFGGYGTPNSSPLLINASLQQEEP